VIRVDPRSTLAYAKKFVRSVMILASDIEKCHRSLIGCLNCHVGAVVETLEMIRVLAQLLVR
jgi:hypothetical protein